MRKIAAVGSALLAIAYIAAGPEPSRGPLPADAPALAARLEDHPADWLAASALAEKALDAPVRDPLALWHASGALAISLAPTLPDPRSSFARAAFFHWNELSAADRKLALDAYAPVLHDWLTFARTYDSIFALTGDFTYLRRAQPEGEEASQYLADLAATNGLFDEYRGVRAALPNGLRSRKRVQTEVVEAHQRVGITIAPQQSDEVPPYVEIYVDGALGAEGAVNAEKELTAEVTEAGKHVVDIMLVNPATRNRTPRQVRVVRVRAL